MSFKTNRRTGGRFRTVNSRMNELQAALSFKGQTLMQAESWLREHQFAYFDQTFNDSFYAPRGLTKIQYMDNFGDLMVLVFDNDNIIVDEKFIPTPQAQRNKAYEATRTRKYGEGTAIDEYEAKR